MPTKKREIKIDVETGKGLLSYEEVLAKCNKPHLLLGNGFSIAYSPERFSFTTLLDSAVIDGIIEKDSHVYRVFQELATSDFESIMRALETSEKVLGVYDDDSGLRAVLKSDSEALKQYLVSIITNNHPEKSTNLEESEKDACLSFIEPYEKIYSLNYDLLLYWATMHSPKKAPDGFCNDEDSENEGYVVYNNVSPYTMKVYYLHGAMHYFDAEDKIIKKTYVHTDTPLVQQTKQSLDEGKYPIFISEGTSEQKKTKILHNAYLNHCFKSFSRIGSQSSKMVSGDLVIFGASLKSNDKHILDAVLNSGIKNIYYGVSSIEGGENIRAAVEEHNLNVEEARKKHLFLYDYHTVNVWGK